MSNNNRDCFVGIARCCERVVFASVDDPEPVRRKENGREIAKLIRAGYRIETWPSDKVRSATWGCNCPKTPTRAALAKARGEKP